MIGRMIFEQGAVEHAVIMLKQIGALASKETLLAKRPDLTGFSPVSGLDESGVSHGRVSSVSRPEALKALAAHVLDAAVLLEANVDSVIGADGAFSQMVGSIGLSGVLGASASAVDVDMKLAQVENPSTNPFVFGRPVAGFVASLPVLHGQFQATDPSRALSEAAAWESTAVKVSEVVSRLDAVVAALGSSAETSWVDKAIERVRRIQWAGGQFAAHASAMGVHAGNLAAVASAEKATAAAAYSSWLAAPVEAKPVVEQVYMKAFPPRLNTGLVPTVPSFNQLLPALDAMPVAPFSPEAIKVPAAPSFERSVLPRVVQDAMVANGFGDMAYASTPQEVIAAVPGEDVAALGGVSPVSPVTQAASVATVPQLTPSAQLASAPQMSPGVTASGGYGAPAVGLTPSLSPRGGLSSASGRTAGHSGAHRGVGGRHGVGSAAGAGAGSVVGLVGRGASTPLTAATPLAGYAPNTPVATTGYGAASTANAAQTINRATAFGGPIGPGGHGANGGSRKRRVRAVTSAVERNGNLRALLGDAPAVLPDVIGDDVRTPRHTI
ncbi:hypothetical protein RIU96_11905 [Corynebacterium sp. Z-1]|uniref:hypothetical protein n=1 Tax=Corynebacterium sp. Z-1 TaxID=3074378 RepID=UPI002882EA49|nr:hypothetical protein [Corynebacterium sp. Z-1]WNI12880.1 hypothetical protein RIU96_11905 [Corynebacterium sp. Z-1]